MAIANPIKHPSEQIPFRPRAALYMRISTKNHGQTTDTQAIALWEYAERRGCE